MSRCWRCTLSRRRSDDECWETSIQERRHAGLKFENERLGTINTNNLVVPNDSSHPSFPSNPTTGLLRMIKPAK